MSDEARMRALMQELVSAGGTLPAERMQQVTDELAVLADLIPEARRLEIAAEVIVAQPPPEPPPTITALTRAALTAIPAPDRDAAVYEYLVDSLNHGADRAAQIASWPRGRQVYYLSWLVESQVANGGLSQLFWNVEPTVIALIPPALRDLGALRAAELFDQATAQAEEEADLRKPRAGETVVEAFSRAAKQSRLSELDGAFYSLTQEFAALRQQMLDSGPSDFYDE